MAIQDATTRTRIDSIKADLRSTSTCSATTLKALQELLFQKNEAPVEKGSLTSKGQAVARRRAGAAATAATAGVTKQPLHILAPREKYILATEVANTTIKSLTDAIKNPRAPLAMQAPKAKPPSEDGRKPTRSRSRHVESSSISQNASKERPASQMTNSPRKRVPRRSSSYSAILTTGPDPGLIATAECARTAFGYLGTPEATKVLGKDSIELQYENGVLALIGKLVALGLDGLAIKEMKSLKKRIDAYLDRNARKEVSQTRVSRGMATERECLASLLGFSVVDPINLAVPLIISFQIYTLRIISRLRRPRIVEAAWEYLQTTRPSSPASLIEIIANTPGGQTKAARQLENLSQTVLALCPSISCADDTSPLQPAPDIVLRLQQLAFVIRRKWWSLVKHQGNEQNELIQPFAKCVTAFTRRSKLSPLKQYRLVESLCAGLAENDFTKDTSSQGPTELLMKMLCSLAQAADLPDEALRWLKPSGLSTNSDTSAARKIIRHVRVATVSLEALLKGDNTIEVENPVSDALDALRGSLAGSSVDLELLFMEVNAFRRIATRLIIKKVESKQDDSVSILNDHLALSIVGASVHFSHRFIGAEISPEADAKTMQRYKSRIDLVYKCFKSIVDSVLACCRQAVTSKQQWQDLDRILQECFQLSQRFEESEQNASLSPGFTASIPSLIVKLSNAYWAIYLQLRKVRLEPEHLLLAMKRSIFLVQSRAQKEADAGHLSMKLERLAEAQEEQGDGTGCRKAFEQCIKSLLNPNCIQVLSDSAAKHTLHTIFHCDAPLGSLARVLKTYHRSILKFGIEKAGQMAFYDDSELPHPARGVLLEWQLGLFLRTLSRNRQRDADLDNSIVSLSKQLQELYVPEKFPVRHIRLALSLLQLSQTLPQITPPTPPSTCEIGTAASEDQELCRYESHYRALWDLKISMQQPGPPSASVIKRCFTSWEYIVDAAPSWGALTERIDDLDEWLHDIESSIEYLNAKGEEYLALPILQLRVQALGLKNSTDSSERLNALCDLALQFLRIGYTGKAGSSFARAERLVENHGASTESKLKWYLGYAEYLLAIGNSTKCVAILSTAQSCALADRHFMDLARQTTTLSGRVRFNIVLANACYVQSLLAASRGSYKEAAQHAKQSVTLNRRTWAALESRSNANKNSTEGTSYSNAEGTSEGTFDPLSSLNSDKGVPLVISVTHDALSRPEFWSLIPLLYRGLMQHSQIYAHQGLFQEAIYVAEQAEKVAAATKSLTLMTDNASWRADCWAQSGRHDKAEAILANIDQTSTRKCLSLAGYYSAEARVHHCYGRHDQEVSSYEVLEQLLDDLTAPSFINTLERFTPSVDTLAEQVDSIALDASKRPLTKPSTATKGRKAVVKPTSRVTAKPAPATRAKAVANGNIRGATRSKSQASTSKSSETLSVAKHCYALSVLKISVLDRKILAKILQDDLNTALQLLREADELEIALGRELSHMWATFKIKFAQGVQQIAQDITANTLPESTIAFPAIGLKEQMSSEEKVVRRLASTTSTMTKGARAKKVKESFIDTLRDARERLVEAHELCASNGSNHLFQQISMALGHVTVLMSAVSVTEIQGSLHPSYAAYMSEIPKCNSLRLTQDAIETEKVQMSRDECLQWPHSVVSTPTPISSVTDFQKKYIDIIPNTWTAISLALNEARDELYITRFESGISPFVLRLPLARHASRDLDDEEFSFEDGKRDFDEIIELSDFSTRTAKDMSSREARQQWWAEREALDTRLHELLINMENIWLGGFKGVFSQHEREEPLLADFRKSLESILDQNLPSRSKKNLQRKPVLDARVLELFIGLGDATNEDVDLDEALIDLVYFVVDILQFNGEHNAYDEIDFDAIVVETHEALRAYHSAARKLDSVSRHTILILDKNLHAFPWESMPCLEKLSISRLPSLAALRERLLAAKPSRTPETAALGHYIDASTGGASFLNPSGDLAHTTKTIKPLLDNLKGSWKHIANRPPTENEFESSLRDKDLVLYFGHGSGAQYIKSKSVRRLYPGEQGQSNTKPGCATTLLFGCSSVHLTENGIYEPSGMLASYLTAGAPAVVGMLWDVTDKDCDRFAMRAGELWGLWPEPLDDITTPTSASKVSTKKLSKGKGRVAQLAQEADPSRTMRRGKKTTPTHDEEIQFGTPRSQKLGLDEAVRDARKVCVLRYLNGAAAVLYGIPVFLE